jgi:NADH-quinone oxidoreductase subunit A
MSYFFQYYALIIFILFASILSSILIVLSYIFDSQKESFEKTTSYECGFEPFGDARNVLNIQFYIVGILFIIFDLEVAFLLP